MNGISSSFSPPSLQQKKGTKKRKRTHQEDVVKVTQKTEIISLVDKYTDRKYGVGVGKEESNFDNNNKMAELSVSTLRTEETLAGLQTTKKGKKKKRTEKDKREEVNQQAFQSMLLVWFELFFFFHHHRE